MMNTLLRRNFYRKFVVRYDEYNGVKDDAEMMSIEPASSGNVKEHHNESDSLNAISQPQKAAAPDVADSTPPTA